MANPKKKGFRLIAFIYENEKAYTLEPTKVWGYRFFDETGKKKVFDVSEKDLLSTKKKDTFNALSLHCYHVHMTKEGKELKLSFEDGDSAYLPCISRENNAVLKTSMPIIYEVHKKDDDVVAYSVVAPTGATQVLSVEDLKKFVLNNLNGKQYMMTHNMLRGYNLKLFTRSNKGSMQYVLVRTNPEYSFPEVEV